jgi:pullulanase
MLNGIRKPLRESWLRWARRTPPPPPPPARGSIACLLTAVGIPMIFAGDEFAVRTDRPFFGANDANKMIDPINFDSLADPWRNDLFNYVSRLVKFRTRAPALSVNDTSFIHVDFNFGKAVVVWVRGRTGIDPPVVVVANFSSWGSDTTDPNAEYRVPNWPSAPPGQSWVEISQADVPRVVPQAWVAREPLYPWEAKIYTTV